VVPGSVLDVRSIVSALDEALQESVIVTGLVPPEGRDLDLLLTEEQVPRLPPILAEHGFRPRGPGVVPARVWTQQWVRIEGCGGLAVDLNPMRRWGLPPDEERALGEEAVPLEGFRHLVRPSPHHTLLIMARRLATRSLPRDRLRKVTEALDADPLVWERARDRAGAWGAGSALSALRTLHEQGRRPTRLQRMRSRLEVTAAMGLARTASRAASRVAVARPRLPRVVAFSGLDGSGKSSQARALASLFEDLGVAVVVEWKPLGHNRSIRAIRRAAKRVLGSVRGLDVEELERSKRPGRSLLAGANPALLGGRQNPVLTHAWATLVSLASAGHYRWVVLRHAGSGRVIVFDRFALDTVAQLRFFYGAERSFRAQRALVRFLSPKPILACLLDIPAQVAMERKPEQYDLDQLKQQEVLLREEAPRLGVTRLDGTRPLEVLCEEIATRLWDLLAR
jgi:thymidylate kinase